MVKGLKRSLERAKGTASFTKAIPFSKTVTVNGATGIGFGFVSIAGLPEGNILFKGAVAYAQFSTTSSSVVATFAATYSIGTVGTTDTDVADAGEATIVASTTASAATAKLSPVTRGTGNTTVILDNTDSSLSIILNLLIPDADISADGVSFAVTGVLNIEYSVLGDD